MGYIHQLVFQLITLWALLPVILGLISIPKDGVTFKCNQKNLEAKVKNCELRIFHLKFEQR